MHRSRDLTSCVIRLPASVLYRVVVMCAFATALLATAAIEHSAASAVIGLLVVLAAARSAAVEVVIDARGVFVRNFLRSYHLAPREVDSVGVSERPLRWFGAGIGLVRGRVELTSIDGTKISLEATQSIHGSDGSWTLHRRPATDRWRETIQNKLNHPSA